MIQFDAVPTFSRGALQTNLYGVITRKIDVTFITMCLYQTI